MQIIFVITGLIFLVATIAQLISDIIRMIDTSKFNFEIFDVSLLHYLPSVEAYLQNFIATNMAESQWVQYLDWVLQQTTFSVLGCTGLFFILFSFLFRKRKSRRAKEDFI